MSADIARRKADHIDAVLSGDVGFKGLTTGLEAIRFEHCALPELALGDVDLSATLFGRPMRLPFLISSMTGGPARAAGINEALGEAAEALGLALAVGSQRIALEERGSAGLGADLRRRCPSIPLVGNIGAAQLLGRDAVDAARQALDMIEADGLFVHLNPLQEAVQRGGDTDWRGVLAAIEAIARAGVPVAVKEVGFGLSAAVVRRLTEAGVVVIDVAGAGGTNWARVEGARDTDGTAVAEAFAGWGVPTARAVREARAVAPEAVIIASGGLRDGVDAAKAIRLGADLAGFAGAVLNAATTSAEAVAARFEALATQLRVACFCTGSADLAQLREAPLQAS
ncbi:type 2 isopentenyl-diphosphate Delta-isomerase [Parvularcula dongshanensis]|uniref:Isopentenyl-diphosphate delta-isomerase n=1 Tax=Parvularcula dongshanensis TaxID=1173995 RepID=A0A840I833_9PROT|nr:type 2 isopentenyl-diphosphate Delta-isomerase [Parvularcula dongshanensis]MBB4660120.1 isopentenyl-diphosphate delta-isomerase [Parvularcula dongshanensis]